MGKIAHGCDESVFHEKISISIKIYLLLIILNQKNIYYF